MAIVRRRYVFTGSVQGVGFRYRAFYAARENGVSGWVKNEYDGSVVMEAEGEPYCIERMIEQIENGRFVDITSVQYTEIPVQDSHSFEITG
ncbi:MAG: acylphosphatase [Ruminococcus sp.]|nr:acylphosphatase [Ruminococcus sp.]